MTHRVTSEWVALKRQLAFPLIDFLHPKTFSIDWQNCVLVRSLADIDNPPREVLEFEFVGANFRKDAPGLTGGERLSAVPSQSLLSLSTTPLPQLFDRQTAIIYSGVLPWRGANALYFRSIAMPFGNSAGALTYALVAFSHKLTNDVLSPERAQTELLEYSDGDWRSLNDPPELSQASA